MLLRFYGRNIRSFRDEFELSLLATAVSEDDAVRSIAWRAGGEPVDVLPVAAVLGSNASGKSNLLYAVADMRRVVLNSFQQGTDDSRLQRIPFLLTSDPGSTTSHYEIDAVVNGVKHTYGFECDDQVIHSEWAYHYPNGRRTLLFRRGLDVSAAKVGAEDTATGRATIALTRRNALFLSTGAATGFSPAVRLVRWIQDNLHLANSSNRNARTTVTANMLKDPDMRDRCMQLVRAADLGIADIRIRRLDPDIIERLSDVARVLNEQLPGDNPIEFDAPEAIELLHQSERGRMAIGIEAESLGTAVWLGLVGPVLQTLSSGSVLLLDELDSSVHPTLVHQIVRLFQDPATNPRRAQLIFNAFDLTILRQGHNRRLLGRDQIWFTEKGYDGASHLYPLTDFSPRKDEAIDDRYLRGVYGAIPIISDAEFDAAVDLAKS